MLESLIHIVTHGAEISSTVGNTPETAIAAVLCAALINFFS
ncbi:YshB family small membrane protein [Pectobacteriaceae bacterium CE70]|nr:MULTISPECIES: YshB family small membrane protein [Enterobacterales]WJV58305.1 YshB family small membrane protein [Pectobacteriaceae bacterium C111]WJV62606.1 YshB family small membrane protein [Pectobacteriaceae bacterium C52]WJV66928.1 YshB family small membrane protein [Pectobacteriaceae bacterium CE70]WJY10917.1 YshB family small membrane protein [Pectobacteriaceae bacterium C80]WJY15062.1 YshB family small membrane protein [Pectobacteriaceae bacterium CE90]